MAAVAMQALLHLYRGSAMAPGLARPEAWRTATAAATAAHGEGSSGSATCLDVDAACMLEVVEHLHPDVLK